MSFSLPKLRATIGQKFLVCCAWCKHLVCGELFSVYVQRDRSNSEKHETAPIVAQQAGLAERFSRICARCNSERDLERVRRLFDKLKNANEMYPRMVQTIDYIWDMVATNFRISKRFLEKYISGQETEQDILVALCGPSVSCLGITFKDLAFTPSLYGLIVAVRNGRDLAKIERVLAGKDTSSYGFCFRKEIELTASEDGKLGTEKKVIDVIFYELSEDDQSTARTLMHEVGHIIQRGLVRGEISYPTETTKFFVGANNLLGVLQKFYLEWVENDFASELLAEANAGVLVPEGNIKSYIYSCLQSNPYYTGLIENILTILQQKEAEVLTRIKLQLESKTGGLLRAGEVTALVAKMFQDQAQVGMYGIAESAVRAIRLLNNKGYTGPEIAILFAKKADLDFLDLNFVSNIHDIDLRRHNIQIQDWLKFAEMMPDKTVGER